MTQSGTSEINLILYSVMLGELPRGGEQCLRDDTYVDWSCTLRILDTHDSLACQKQSSILKTCQ